MIPGWFEPQPIRGTGSGGNCQSSSAGSAGSPEGYSVPKVWAGERCQVFWVGNHKTRSKLLRNKRLRIIRSVATPPFSGKKRQSVWQHRCLKARHPASGRDVPDLRRTEWHPGLNQAEIPTSCGEAPGGGSDPTVHRDRLSAPVGRSDRRPSRAGTPPPAPAAPG